MTVSDLRNAFQTYQRKELPCTHKRRSAVLVPFFMYNEEMYLLFTERTETVEHHKGEISFPGGMCEPDDADAVATALREANEEIGLPLHSVEVLGMFDDYTTKTGFCITPVVGFIQELPLLAINIQEVAQALSVPASVFLADADRETTFHDSEGSAIQIFYYNYGSYEIWGATAAIARGIMQHIVLASS